MPPKSNKRSTISTAKRKAARVALDGAVVRVVVPTAADLTDAQRERALAAGVPDLDAFARGLAGLTEGRAPARRADETDEALALRTRHYFATRFAKQLVLDLEALRPIAEASPDEVAHEDAWALAEALGAAEAGHAAGSDATRLPLYQAAIAALERARRWAIEYEKHADRHVAEISRKGFYRGPFPVDVDLIKHGAIHAAPELAVVPVSAWKKAIAAWPGLSRQRGGARTKGTEQVTWYRVIFKLLQPYRLAPSSAEAIRDLVEGTARRKKRGE